MINYARIINGVAVDVSTSPLSSFHQTLAAEFVQVPENVKQGWTLINSVWAAPVLQVPVVTPQLVGNLKPTPPQFMLLLTLMERVNIRGARAENLVVDDLLQMLEDPRLTVVELVDTSVIEALNYMTTTTPPLLTPARVARILTGLSAQT